MYRNDNIIMEIGCMIALRHFLFVVFVLFLVFCFLCFLFLFRQGSIPKYDQTLESWGKGHQVRNNITHTLQSSKGGQNRFSDRNGHHFEGKYLFIVTPYRMFSKVFD